MSSATAAPARGTRAAGGGAPRASEARRTGAVSWMALPALGFFLVFGALPLVGVLFLSFTNWASFGPITNAGLSNWRSVLGSPATWKAVGLTFELMIVSWLVQTPLSILLGVFTAGHQKYRAVLAVLYFLPLLLSGAAISITYKALLDPNFGLAASLHLGFLNKDWLGSSHLVVWVVVYILSWQYIPFHTLVYQGGVRQIPASLYEAASIDGAGRVKQFFSITLPQLKYTIITSSTLMVVGSLTSFDLIYVLTAGGPGTSTQVLALDMYKLGFNSNEMGPASAIAVFIVVIGLGLALLVQRIGGKDSSASQLEGA